MISYHVCGFTFRQIYDEMGIPYTVILTPDMVETGTLQLRNRDTRLKVSLALLVQCSDDWGHVR